MTEAKSDDHSVRNAPKGPLYKGKSFANQLHVSKTHSYLRL